METTKGELRMIFCIVVAFNAEKWIEQCLASLYASSVPVNVVVVDNASTDETATIVGRFPKAIYLPLSENVGFGRANNIGIAHALKAEADYVFLINQDAYVYPNTLEILLGCARDNPSYGILSPLHLNGDATEIDPLFLEYICHYSTRTFISDIVLHKQIERIYPTNYANAAAWLMPSDFLRHVGGFDPLFFMYGEDDDVLKRALYHGYSIGYVPEARICHYRERSAPASQQNRSALSASSNRQYVLMLLRLKDTSQSLVVCFLRLIAFIGIQVVSMSARGQFTEIRALLSAYARILYRMPVVMNHRRRSMTRGAHWLESIPGDEQAPMADRQFGAVNPTRSKD